MSKFDEHLENLKTYTPKKLRTLRNSLNNRIESIKENGEDGASKLSASHRLYGLEIHDCEALLKQVRKQLKELP